MGDYGGAAALLDGLVARRWVLAFNAGNTGAWGVLMRHDARYVGVASWRPDLGVMRTRVYVETRAWATATELDAWFRDSDSRLVTIRRAGDPMDALTHCREATGPGTGPVMSGLDMSTDPADLLSEPAPPAPAGYEWATVPVPVTTGTSWVIDVDAVDTAGSFEETGRVLKTMKRARSVTGRRVTGGNAHEHHEYHVTTTTPTKPANLTDGIRRTGILRPGVITTDALRIHAAQA